MELFVTSRKLEGNPSLRVYGQVSSMHRIFIWEDFSEDADEQWARDEVTGEQNYADDERSRFRTWDNTESGTRRKEGIRKEEKCDQRKRESLPWRNEARETNL